MKITKRSDNENTRLPVTQSDPVRSLRSMHDMMDRLFSDHFLMPLGSFDVDRVGTIGGFAPKVDISETEKEIKVRAEVPGIDPDDVSVEVTEDTLSLSGTIEKSSEEQDENYYRMERQSGHFSREFMLPSKIDADSVKAEAKNGVISITLAKLPSEQRRKIAIQK